MVRPAEGAINDRLRRVLGLGLLVLLAVHVRLVQQGPWVLLAVCDTAAAATALGLLCGWPRVVDLALVFQVSVGFPAFVVGVLTTFVPIVTSVAVHLLPMMAGGLALFLGRRGLPGPGGAPDLRRLRCDAGGQPGRATGAQPQPPARGLAAGRRAVSGAGRLPRHRARPAPARGAAGGGGRATPASCPPAPSLRHPRDTCSAITDWMWGSSSSLRMAAISSSLRSGCQNSRKTLYRTCPLRFHTSCSNRSSNTVNRPCCWARVLPGHPQLDFRRDHQAEVAGELGVGSPAVGGDVSPRRQPGHEHRPAAAGDAVHQLHQPREHPAVLLPAVAAVVEVPSTCHSQASARSCGSGPRSCGRSPAAGRGTRPAPPARCRKPPRSGPSRGRRPRRARAGPAARADRSGGTAGDGRGEQRRLAPRVPLQHLGQVREQLHHPVHRRSL